MENLNLTLGAIPHSNHIGFLLWAPYFKKAYLQFTNLRKPFLMESNINGFHTLKVEKKYINKQYFFTNKNTIVADPASRYQSKGVTGPSSVMDLSFAWTDKNWKGISLEKYIIYELHVGTYTKAGTFSSLMQHLDNLVDLGITAIELMPCGQFPGHHNWGYDTVFPFAIQNSYGKPDDLQRLVDCCHNKGLAVIMDVVYNHQGPEGNIFHKLAPYFSKKYTTVWGNAINFDDQYSDFVRQFYLENAIYWFTQYHIDALRLDALHAIYDKSAYPFLSELLDVTKNLSKKLNKPLFLFGEDDLNDVTLITNRKQGGHGIDAQWNDDFHHALHAALTKERIGYYEDFGKINQIAKAYQQGFVYDGIYSRFRKRRHGSSSKNFPGKRFVVFSQNHDQIGNRLFGDRMTERFNIEQLKLIAAITLLSSNIPLLFMGEEYGETAPFLYFTDHSDPVLIKKVQMGRKIEFLWKKIPNSQNKSQFLKSKLDHQLKNNLNHKTLYNFYKKIIRLRKTNQVLNNLNKQFISVKVNEETKLLVLIRKNQDGMVFIICNFSNKKVTTRIRIPAKHSNLLFSTNSKTNVPKIIENKKIDEFKLMPYEFVLYEKIGLK